MSSMDTAPRDGTRFMALWPAQKANKIPSKWRETWFVEEPRIGGFWHYKEGSAFMFHPHAPTEWRPK